MIHPDAHRPSTSRNRSGVTDGVSSAGAADARHSLTYLPSERRARAWGSGGLGASGCDRGERMMLAAGIERDERGYTERRGAPARRDHARRLRPTRGNTTIAAERGAGR